MRLLLDSCVWGPVGDERKAAGHDVLQVRKMGPDPGDDEVLERSVREDRILVTLDKDFGELVFVLGRPHMGILRLVNTRAKDQGRTILYVLSRHSADLEAGALVVAQPDRIRIRRPEEEM